MVVCLRNGFPVKPDKKTETTLESRRWPPPLRSMAEFSYACLNGNLWATFLAQAPAIMRGLDDRVLELTSRADQHLPR